MYPVKRTSKSNFNATFTPKNPASFPAGLSEFEHLCLFLRDSGCFYGFDASQNKIISLVVFIKTDVFISVYM
tara:strand:+ start:1900 stop:2115 length:216 start_codon:yes stop_codon:yes gene_type:complete